MNNITKKLVIIIGDNPTLSVIVQQLAFRHGYKWCTSNGTIPFNSNKPMLFLTNYEKSGISGGKLITHSDSFDDIACYNKNDAKINSSEIQIRILTAKQYLEEFKIKPEIFTIKEAREFIASVLAKSVDEIEINIGK